MSPNPAREPISPSAPSPNQPLRILLVEDKADVRASWSKLLNSFPDIQCAGEYATGEDALHQVATVKPDAVLMDIFLPRMSGIECTARMKAAFPKTPIIILTTSDDDEIVFRALEAGADGYLLKRTKPAELRAALLDALSGGAPMTSEIARRVVESFRQKGKSREGAPVLSGREEEVLVLLTKGYSNKEIGDQLNLSTETIRTHLKHIYEKMHVRSRAEAVARYMSSGRN